MSHSFATPGTVALQVPLSIGLPRQEYWNGLSFPSSGDLPNPGMESMSPGSWAGRFFTIEPLGKPMCRILVELKIMNWIALETIRKYFLIVFFPNIFTDPNSKAFYLISTDSNHVCVRNDLLKRLRGPMLLTCSWGNTWSLMHLQIMSSLWKGKGK